MPPGGRPDWFGVMTVEQVASYLQLNKLTVYRYIREGRLPASKVGKAYRIRWADLNWFLESARIAPARTARAEARPVAVPPARRRESVVVAPQPDPAELRYRDLTVTPIEWVIRNLH